MKALYIVEPGRTEVREIDKPSPAAGEALLGVRMVGLCGSDLSAYRGKNPMQSHPVILGHEISATVESLGEGVGDQIRPGMKVTVRPYTSCGVCPSCRHGRPNACRDNQTMGVARDGAITEYIVAPAERIVPAGTLEAKALALVEPLAVGSHAVTRGRVAAGQSVMVLGCGAIGLGAIAGAAFAGATVIAVDVDEAKLDIARKAGAAHTINSAAEPLHERLVDLTGEGPDVVIEAVGLPETYRTAVEEVAFAGRVVYVGYAQAPVRFETKLFVQKELDILGSRNALGEFPTVIEFLSGGTFPVDQVVTHVVDIDSAGQALADWAANPSAITRILVDLDV